MEYETSRAFGPQASTPLGPSYISCPGLFLGLRLFPGPKFLSILLDLGCSASSIAGIPYRESSWFGCTCSDFFNDSAEPGQMDLIRLYESPTKASSAKFKNLQKVQNLGTHY